MIRQVFIAVLIWVCVGESAAWAQDNDWTAVMNVRAGTTIGIVTRVGRAGARIRHQVCRFSERTAGGIECAVVKADHEWLQEFTRDQISEIHLESVRVRRTYWGVLIGALIGGGLFAAAAAGQNADAGSAALYFVYGGSIGGSIGAQSGPRRSLKTQHGAVLYRSRTHPTSSGDHK